MSKSESCLYLYVHLLVPDQPDFVPQPEQVAAFFERLNQMGSVPLEASFDLWKLSGTYRTGTNQLTGEVLVFPENCVSSFDGISQIAARIAGLGKYSVEMIGKGPAQLSPFPLLRYKDLAGWEYTGIYNFQEAESTGEYRYEVQCHLREMVVGLTNYTYGEPSTKQRDYDEFRNPRNNNRIEVRHGVRARFWVEFRFGEYLWPRIEDSLELLHPEIVAAAVEIFGTSFYQGCLFT